MKRLAVAAALLLLATGACRKERPVSANLNVANKVAVRMVRLYYESPRMMLIAEERNLPVPESAAAAVPIVVRELMKGPAVPTSLRLFPEDTVVRGAWLLPGGTVVVDLGGATLSRGWPAGSHQEMMAAYSLVHTLTKNFTDAARVRVLVNGSPAETLAGHLSLERSLAPMPSLVEPPSR